MYKILTVQVVAHFALFFSFFFGLRNEPFLFRLGLPPGLLGTVVEVGVFLAGARLATQSVSGAASHDPGLSFLPSFSIFAISGFHGTGILRSINA